VSEWRRQVEGKAPLKRKKVAMLAEDGAKERGVGDLQEAEFEELNAGVDTSILFPELRTGSQHLHEITQFAGTHD
jgi:hypothetical protein